MTCAVCSGCLPLPLLLTRSSGGTGTGGAPVPVAAPIAYTYDAGDWGHCSLPCAPGGSQSRTVSCVAARGATRVSVEASRCAGQSAPSSSRACNAGIACTDVGILTAPSPRPPGSSISPSWALTCTSACTPLLGNGQCEAACNSVGCQFDGGDCLQANVDPCASRTSCSSCLAPITNPETPSCGWCASRGQCASGGRSSPRAGDSMCAAAQWIAHSCNAPEPTLAFTSPLAGVLYKAGDLVPVAWSGGLAGGSVTLAWIIGDASASSTYASGFGLPTSPVPNTGSFSWTLQAGAPTSSSVRLLAFSSSSSDNFALSPVFRLDGRPRPGYRWLPSAFGACSQPVCGGGTATRTVQCMMRLNSASAEVAVADTECIALVATLGAKPSLTTSCNTAACPNVCPAVPLCQACPTCCSTCSCRRQSSGFDEFCGMVYTNPMNGQTTTFGCDTRDSTYQHCCQQRGLTCDDGCTNVATWTETYTGGCSTACGGGTQYRGFTCRGRYTKYSSASLTCYDQFCKGSDPSGNYRCNTQPCETASWSVGEWGSCSRLCAGLGTQSRTVICRSSSNVTVSDGQCTTAKPDVQQTCNLRECRFMPLVFLTPSLGQIVAYGSNVNVSWTGGLEEGLIVLETAAATEAALFTVSTLGTGGAALSDPSIAGLSWVSSAAGMGTVPNALWWVWTPPASLLSGVYLVRLSSGAPGVNSTLSQPFWLRGATNFTVELPTISVDGAGSNDIGACLKFGLTYSGTLGSDSAPVLVPSGLIGSSVTSGRASFSFVAPDPGTVLSANLVANWLAAPACRTGASITTQAAVLHMGTASMNLALAAFDTHTQLANAVSSRTVLSPGTVIIRHSACSSFDGCPSCTQQSGCGWCANTTGLARGEVGSCRPVVSGSATCSDMWDASVTDVSQVPSEGPGNLFIISATCPDRCGAAVTCFDCAMSTGCGFCASTSSCMAGNSTSPLLRACSSGWTVDANVCVLLPSTPSSSVEPSVLGSSHTGAFSSSATGTGSISAMGTSSQTGTMMPTNSPSSMPAGTVLYLGA